VWEGEADPYPDFPTSAVILPMQQLRQPCDVDGDPSGLVFREHLRLPRLDLGGAAVDVGDRLPVGVADDIAARYLVGTPGRREAAWSLGHGGILPVHPIAVDNGPSTSR
jgi:hypothetical protein